MGSKDNSKGQSLSTSTGSSYESALSREQLKILQQRQQDFETFWLPEIQKRLDEGLASYTVGSQAFETAFNASRQQVNRAFDSSQQQINQNLAQQGLAADANVSAALKAQNQRARMSSLAQAYSDQIARSEENKQQYAELLSTTGAALSPQPTTSAEYLQKSTSTSTGKSSGGGFTVANLTGGVS